MRFCLSCPVHYTCARSSSEHMTVPVGKCPSSLTLPNFPFSGTKMCILFMDQHQKHLQLVLVTLLLLCASFNLTLCEGAHALFRCHSKECGCWVGWFKHRHAHSDNLQSCAGTSKPSMHAVWITSPRLITVLCTLGQAALLCLQTACNSATTKAHNAI